MAQTWNPKGMRKWTMAEALSVTSGEILKMKLPERAELAAFLQSKFNQRVASYRRAKSYNNPYAYQKLMDDFKELSEVADYNFDFMSKVIEVKGRKHTLGSAYAALDMPNQKLHSYISQMQDFFSAKTSTVSGWRKVISNESEKLFGYTEYKRGGKTYKRLNHLMTEEERGAFWKLYEEIRKSGRTVIYSSDAMRETGFTRIWRKKLKNNEWNFDDLTGMMNDMLSELKASGQYVRDIPEYKPGISSNPTQPGLEQEEDSDLFEW